MSVGLMEGVDTSSGPKKEEKELLYEFLEDKFKWTRQEIESRVKEHEEAHTVEAWRPFVAVAFPEVF